MKTLFSILLSLLLTMTASADDFFGLFKKTIKGSGDMVTQEYDLDAFTEIKSRGSFDINITVGKKQSVTVTFDDNLIDLIELDVRGRTLNIDSEGSFSSRRGCKIHITIPEFEGIRMYGSGDIVVEDLDNDMFEASLSGSGDISLEGEVKELELSISGSGEIDSRKLKAEEVYAKISGSGDIETYASEWFKGLISGSGDIDVYGDPENVSRTISGSGSIRMR